VRVNHYMQEVCLSDEPPSIHCDSHTSRDVSAWYVAVTLGSGKPYK
jgi:hypothetical protein